MKVPTMAEELLKCERDYVQFVFDNSARDVGDAAKLAKVGVREFETLLLKHRLIKKSSKQAKPITQRDNLSKVERIKMACGKRGASANEIHKKIGGSYGSLGVYLAEMKGRGELAVQGERGSYRYRLPA